MQDTRARFGVGNYFQSVRTVLCVAVAQGGVWELAKKNSVFAKTVNNYHCSQ